jgi:hypothetical protein
LYGGLKNKYISRVQVPKFKSNSYTTPIPRFVVWWCNGIYIYTNNVILINQYNEF